MEYLKSYASGDGSLSFSYCDGDKAVSKEVTKEAVIKHLVAKENRHLYDKGYRAMSISGRWHLVKMYQRVGEPRLDGTFDIQAIADDDDETVYTVKINKDDHFFREDGTVRIANMFVTFEPDARFGVGPQEVKNMNILGSLQFFLSHEREIATQIEEAKKFKAPPLFDASKARRVEKYITGYAGESEDIKANMTDIVTDILHLCEKRGVEFDQIVRMARSHFGVER